MTHLEAILLIAAGVVGGGFNAIAGGGTFFTFPALMAAGLDPLTANVSNAVAIYPGHAAAVVAYRKELRELKASLWPTCIRSALGATAGASLLIAIGPNAFTNLVPFLVLAATLLFAFGIHIHDFFSSLKIKSRGFPWVTEILFAGYGGFFGAGLGILLMASIAILGSRDIHEANALKNLLATVITTVSVVVFTSIGAIAWPQTLCVLFGAILGGYIGGRVSRHFSDLMLRKIVISTGLSLATIFFAARICDRI